ncbi:hypothetical protein [Bosea sp. RAF48]
MTRRRYELADHESAILSPPLPNEPRGRWPLYALSELEELSAAKKANRS